jgi:hypothetical protein
MIELTCQRPFHKHLDRVVMAGACASKGGGARRVSVNVILNDRDCVAARFDMLQVALPDQWAIGELKRR